MSQQPTSSQIESIQSHLAKGENLAAYELAKPCCPLLQWTGYEAMYTAARLAMALGRTRLASALDYKAWKQYPDNPTAYYQALFTRIHYKPAALLSLEISDYLKQDLKDETKADLLAFSARLHANLRDFSQAHIEIEAALSLQPQSSWIHTEHSYILDYDDRYEESLEAANTACQLDPHYRPPILQYAHLLTLLKRDGESLDFIQQAALRNESPYISYQEFTYHSEREDIEPALNSLDEYVRRSPLLSERGHQQIAAHRADLYYLAGDTRKFIQYAQSSRPDSFQQKCATFFAKQPKEKQSRRKLDVPFIRQHNMTCAPATLASLSSYFGHDHNHLDIAESICYEGTPWHKERAWAEEHGFITREFKVTFEIAKALIDRGIPFTLTTIDVTNAHLQACIGYDEGRGLLILRDPTHRHYGEIIWKGLVQQHPVSGPRGMLFIPPDKEHCITDLEFPDALDYDASHALALALDQHDLSAAKTSLERFQKTPHHSPLHTKALYRLASYEEKPIQQLEALDQQIKHYPDSQLLAYQRYCVLYSLDRYTEAENQLNTILAKKNPDPIFSAELGHLLLSDERRDSSASYFLRQSLRRNPADSRSLFGYARLLHRAERKEDALKLKRFAACSSPEHEGYSSSYFHSSQWLRQSPAALEFLQQRCNKVGLIHSGPHLTLMQALEGIDLAKALDLAREILARFPEDHSALLTCCETLAAHGHEETALQHLESIQNQSHTREIDFLRLSARIYSLCGKREVAMETWQKLASLSTDDAEAHCAIASWLEETISEEEAASHLQNVLAKHPDNITLKKLLTENIQFKGPKASIPILKSILEQDPHHLWALRELALEQLRDGQNDTSLATANRALDYDKKDSLSYSTLAYIQRQSGYLDESLTNLKTALTLSIDNTSALKDLIDETPVYAERVKALQFIKEQLIQQVSNGDAVLSYREVSSIILDSEQRLDDLKHFHSERPDLWQTWSTLLAELSQRRDLKEAQQIAHDYRARHPLLPRTWLDSAQFHVLAGMHEEANNDFKRCAELSPGWDTALQQWIDLLESMGHRKEALEIADQAIQRNPLTPSNYGYKADLEEQLGHKERAFETLASGLRKNPFYTWGWQRLLTFSQELGLATEFQTLLDDVEKTRKQLPGWWKLKSNIHNSNNDSDKALQAIQKAIELQPLSEDLLDQRAVLLTQEAHYKDALEQCQAKIHGSRPRVLIGREAWVYKQMGQSEKAWDMMNSLAKEHPDYIWAQSQLADWAQSINAYEHLKEAANSLIKLAPNSAYSWSSLSEAHDGLGDKHAALKAISEAFKLEPHSLYSGRNKLLLEFELKHFEAAESTLRQLSYYHDSCWIAVDRIRLSLAQNPKTKNLEPQLESFFDLQEQQVDSQAFQYLRTVYDDAGRFKEYASLLMQRFTQGLCTTTAEAEGLGSAAARSSRPFSSAKRILKASQPDKITSVVLSFFCRIIPDAHPSKKEQSDKFIQTHKALFKNNTTSYEHVLNYCADHRVDDLAIELALDWKTRLNDLTQHGYMLVAVALDSHNLDSSFEVRQESIKRFPQWQGNETTRLCAGFYMAAKLNDYNSAKEYLSGFQIRDCHGVKYYETIYYLTQSALAGIEQDQEAAQQALIKAKPYFEEFPNDKTLAAYALLAADSLHRNFQLFKKPAHYLKKWANIKVNASGPSWLSRNKNILAFITLPILLKLVFWYFENK